MVLASLVLGCPDSRSPPSPLPFRIQRLPGPGEQLTLGPGRLYSSVLASSLCGGGCWSSRAGIILPWLFRFQRSFLKSFVCLRRPAVGDILAWRFDSKWANISSRGPWQAQ